MQKLSLMLVTNSKVCGFKRLKEIVQDSCCSGVDMVQLREKNLSSRQLLSLANSLRRITKKNSCRLLVNDRLDIALLSKADGIHSPAKGVPIKYFKKFSKHFLYGKSVHSTVGASKAEKEGYDYVIFGPVFRTASKIKYGKPHGLKKLNEVCRKSKKPVLAIGGITPKRAANCIKAGAGGVSVINAILESPNVKKTVSDFKASLESVK